MVAILGYLCIVIPGWDAVETLVWPISDVNEP